MKYMGSKRSMLQGTLGSVILEQTTDSDRFFDLFTGSGAVASFVAERTSCAVVASDLQSFACVLAGAIVERTTQLDANAIWKSWHSKAVDLLEGAPVYAAANAFDAESWMTARRTSVDTARLLGQADIEWPFVSSYAGHYFSPRQAYELEALRRSLPTTDNSVAQVALAALVIAASECAAAPGHTAQPFTATATGARFLFEAWRREVFERAQSALNELSSRAARTAGRTVVADALTVADSVLEGDVVFVDPPYSAVQYSRFYHVLETLARGRSGQVSGVGRYPPQHERPKSHFSSTRHSGSAAIALLEKLRERGAVVIVTFPRDLASNGLSGGTVEELARRLFRVRRLDVNGRFSTLGGGPSSRGARLPAFEVILVLEPT
jgi:adenine-specific DNA-methyltransferase